MARALVPNNAPAGAAGAERPKRKPGSTGDHAVIAGASRTRPPHRIGNRSASAPRHSRPLAPGSSAERPVPHEQPGVELALDALDPSTVASAEALANLTQGRHAAGSGIAAGDLSRLKLSPSPTLIFEVDAGSLDSGSSARRATVRLIASVRNRPRPPAADAGDSGAAEVSAVVIIKALAPTSLLACVRAVTRGGASVPPELLSQLMPIAEHEHPGFRPGELTSRELAVLRMLAEGLTTREIAEQMSYSERTVKNVVHDLLEKLNCRTRAHAVALATRHGMI